MLSMAVRPVPYCFCFCSPPAFETKEDHKAQDQSQSRFHYHVMTCYWENGLCCHGQRTWNCGKFEMRKDVSKCFPNQTTCQFKYKTFLHRCSTIFCNNWFNLKNSFSDLELQCFDFYVLVNQKTCLY